MSGNRPQTVRLRPPTQRPRRRRAGGRTSSCGVDPLGRSGLCPLSEAQADDFRTSMSGNRPQTVRLPDDFRTVSGHCFPGKRGSCFPRLASRALTFFGIVGSSNSNVRKPSGSRPVTGRKADDFRTLPLGRTVVPAPLLGANVRKSSAYWTEGGRFPDLPNNPTQRGKRQIECAS